jgi:hypothetical protein
MDPLTLIILLLLGYVVYSSGTLAQFGLGAPPSIVPTQSNAVAPPSAIAVAPTTSASSIGQEQNTLLAAGTTLNLIPVAGPAISAAYSVLVKTLLSASAARAKAATNENAAVAKGVPGWDAAISQIVAAYNNGSITATQVQSALTIALSNYWAEVTPQIQSGRNGCNGGSSCPGVPNISSAYVTNEGGNNYCSGDIGAACCVGCADLNLSTANMNWAVNHASVTGQAVTAFVQVVFASKYGGVNRPSYTVTFTPPAAIVAAL